jgi:predicted peptidase
MTYVVFAFALPFAAAHGQSKTGFFNKEYEGAKYVVFVPHDHKPDTQSPVILFLHGSGSTGDDGQKQAKGGLASAIRKNEKSFAFITVFPQSQKRSWRADSEDGKRAVAILDTVMKEYNGDPKRVYLTGLSMGGFGTWSLAAKYPERWAAIAPICGGGDVKSASKIKDLPTWNFHGDADPTVSVELSRKMIAALKAAGGNPRYTEYPGVQHNSWDRAYGTAELYTWFLEQKLK